MPGILEIKPDGVPIRIHYNQMMPGMSVFVPVLNIKKGREEIRKGLTPHGYKLRIYTVVEKGKSGLRVWRLA